MSSNSKIAVPMAAFLLVVPPAFAEFGVNEDIVRHSNGVSIGKTAVPAGNLAKSDQFESMFAQNDTEERLSRTELSFVEFPRPKMRPKKKLTVESVELEKLAVEFLENGRRIDPSKNVQNNFRPLNPPPYVEKRNRRDILATEPPKMLESEIVPDFSAEFEMADLSTNASDGRFAYGLDAGQDWSGRSRNSDGSGGNGEKMMVVPLKRDVNRSDAAAANFVVRPEKRLITTSEGECLSQAIYFEARGEGQKGWQAITEVIINRANSPLFPDTICDVVRQGEQVKFGCQFSFYCDGKPENITEPLVFIEIKKFVKRALEAEMEEVTGGAFYFHTTQVNPSWSRNFKETVRIGRHVFYTEHSS